MQLKAAERAIENATAQSHNTAVRDLCAFLESQAEPRPMVIEAFRVGTRLHALRQLTHERIGVASAVGTLLSFLS